jgi:hypothetical protein
MSLATAGRAVTAIDMRDQSSPPRPQTKLITRSTS